MTDGEKLGYLAGMAAMYRSANETEKGQIINNMIVAGSALGMFFHMGMSSEDMYQKILSRTELLWMSTIVHMPQEPAPIVQCKCQQPTPVLEFPKGRNLWDLIAQEDN